MRTYFHNGFSFLRSANMKWDGEDNVKVLEIAYAGVMRYSMWDSTHSSNPFYMKKKMLENINFLN